MATVPVLPGFSSDGGITATTTWTATLPANISDGNLGLVVVSVVGNVTITGPAGWAEITGSPLLNGVGNSTTAAFQKTMAAADSSVGITGNISPGARWAAGGVVLTGAVTTLDNIATNVDTTSNTTVVYPAITPVAADCLQVALIGSQYAATTTTGVTPASGWTEYADDASTNTTNGKAGIEVSVKQLSGQAGSAQSTVNGSSASNARDSTFILTVAPTPVYSATAALSGGGTLTDSVTPALAATATLAGAGTLVGAGVPAFSGGVSAALGGAGTLTFAVVPKPTGTAAFAGSGALTVVGSATGADAVAVARFSGSGSLAARQFLIPAGRYLRARRRRK